MSSPSTTPAQSLAQAINGVTVTTDNIIEIVGNLMKKVEQFATLTGPQKRDLVLSTVKSQIDQSKLADTQKAVLDAMLQTGVVGSVVDAFVNLAPTLGLNAVAKIAKCCG